MHISLIIIRQLIHIDNAYICKASFLVFLFDQSNFTYT